MNNIKKRLELLAQEQRDQLMYAFENGFTQIVVDNKDEFIGVNVENVGNVDILESHGSWALGRIRRENG